MKEKTYLKVPTSVIRNDDFSITADEFLLYARLCFLYFRSYKSKEFTVDTYKHRAYLKIADNRTLKNRLNKLSLHRKNNFINIIYKYEEEDKYSMDAPYIEEQARIAYEQQNASQNLCHKRYPGGHAMTQERFEYILNWLKEVTKE